MAQFKNTTIDDTGFIRLPIGTTGQRPTGETARTRYNTETNVIEFFNGTSWIGIGLLDGSSQSTAAPSAQAIKTVTGTNTNKAYWIALPTVGATNLFCIMDSAWNGGGWIMAYKATQGTTFNYFASYWTSANVLNESSVNQDNADAKFHSFNYFSAKDMLARWPDIGQGGSINNVGNWTWLQNDYINGQRATLLAFHSNPSAYPRWVSMTQEGEGNFVQDAKTYAGWANGVFSSQTDVRFYGFNYTNNRNYGTNARVRWGFGWNENGGGVFPVNSGSGAPGSNDVSGGIGMDSGYGNYSAGDRIACCNDTTGINRQARVEVYVR